MKLEFREQAKRDMRWFRRYYAERFPEGRGRAERHFRATIELILANPRAGQQMITVPTRKIPVLRTPFVLIYIIAGDTLEIIRVWDARADPERLFES
jgi:plasmid stabilization system protein ParE